MTRPFPLDIEIDRIAAVDIMHESAECYVALLCSLDQEAYRTVLNNIQRCGLKGIQNHLKN